MISVIGGQNMLFISQTSSFQVPWVYAIYIVAETQKTHTIMEYIRGETLQLAWSTLSFVRREQISAKLRFCFD